jgi:hypothetical protein
MMNEQFRKLEKQCWDYQTNHLNADKFAMLIVQECIEQAHSVADSRGVNDDMIYGADTAAARIAKHFGVNNETK